MTTTFVTDGDVRLVYNNDGSTKCYYMSRKEGGPIRLQRCIDEYFQAGNHVFIDSHGRPWVKK